MGADALVLYHWPQSRSATARWALEESGAPYELKIFNMPKGEHKSPEVLALNPLGKLPVLKHGDAVVTETTAIVAYLADTFPEAKLAPPPGDKARGPYLRWLVMSVATIEPAIIDRAMKREPGMPAMSPYGSFDTLIDMLAKSVSQGTWLLGERFSAADIVIGSGLRFGMVFGVLPERPEFKAYVERVTARPAIARAIALDAQIMAAQS